MKSICLSIIVYIFIVFISHQAFAAEKWSLDSAVTRLYEVSLELQASKKEVEIFEQKLKGASKWPNPSIEIAGSGKLGKEDGQGGYDPTSLKLSQPLPITRIARQEAVSREELESASASADQTKLQLEYDLSLDFHEIQLKRAIWEITKQKHQLVKQIESRRTKKGELIRFLKPIDKARLRIIKNNSFVDEEQAEGEYNEVLAELKSKLQLSSNIDVELVELSNISQLPTLQYLRTYQVKHPLLRSLAHKIKASEMQVQLEKSKRFHDPVLSVFAEEDIFANQRQQFYGASLSLTIPIWDFNSTSIEEAKAEAEKYSYKSQAKQLELERSLDQGYKHLEHLYSLGKQFETKMLPQSKTFLDLAIKSFAIGESGILALIDAYDNYYDARLRHLKVLKDAWIEFSKVRLISNLHVENDKN